MAMTRDQAARVIRAEPAQEEGDALDTCAQVSEPPRTHVADEARRRPADAPGPAVDAPSPAPARTAQKSGKRKFVLLGVAALLGLAAASYGVYYVLVGRFYI